MRKGIFICLAAFVSFAAMALQGCSSFRLGDEPRPGAISLAIGEVPEPFYSDGTFLKGNSVIADTNSFILTIYSTEGEKIYDGKYGERPEEIVVTPGGYEIGLYSKRFNPPAFDTPVFGEEHTIVVSENEQARVSFLCRQINAGVKLTFANDFIARFPGRGVHILQGNERLAYDYGKGKYAYVSTDNFYIAYNDGTADTVLLEKSLSAGQMITMKLSYSASKTSASAFRIEVDTTREWVSYNYNVGLKIPTGAISIAEAKERIGEKNMKVFGYIIGGDPTTNSLRVGPPFQSRTSIVIAPSMSERNRNNMMVVELPSGAVREALNLVVYPDNVGRPVVVTGTIVESYYGYPGIKNTKAYTLL
ncbi:MAG: DUF4493 domain-containing protein [Bacteroidales bacterium]|nr:DUF4493 domain-containing protein [Bacteroidales bacterium]